MMPKRFLGSTTLGDESGVSATLGDGAVVARVGVENCCSGWKHSRSLSMALLTGVPCSRNGTGGWGWFLSSHRRSSTVALSLSALDASGMGNLVGRNATFSAGMVACVCGMWMLHCLQWCIAGPTHQPCLPLLDQVVLRFSFGSCAMHLVPSGPGGVELKSKRPNT